MEQLVDGIDRVRTTLGVRLGNRVSRTLLYCEDFDQLPQATRACDPAEFTAGLLVFERARRVDLSSSK